MVNWKQYELSIQSKTSEFQFKVSVFIGLCLPKAAKSELMGVFIFFYDLTVPSP